MKGKQFLFISLSYLMFVPAIAQDTISGERLLVPEDFYVQWKTTINPIVIDVRPYEDYKKNRLPGALPADRAAILLKISDTLDKENPVFLYCETTQRSRSAAQILIEKGFLKVYVLDEGILGWVKRDYPVDKKRIHKTKRRKR